MLGASGVVEAAATALAVDAGLLPPTHNLDDPDPACPLDHVRKEPREIRAGVRPVELVRVRRPERQPAPRHRRARRSERQIDSEVRVVMKISGSTTSRCTSATPGRRRSTWDTRSASRSTARADRRPGWPDQRSLLLRQGDIQIVLTSGLAADHPAAEYVQRHGDGVASSDRGRRRDRGVRRAGCPGRRPGSSRRPRTTSGETTVVIARGRRLRRRDPPAGRAARTAARSSCPAAIEMTRARAADRTTKLLQRDRPPGDLRAGRASSSRPSKFYQDVFGFPRDLRGVHRGRRAGHGLEGGAEPVEARHVHADRAGPEPPAGPDRRLPRLARGRRRAAHRVAHRATSSTR